MVMANGQCRPEVPQLCCSSAHGVPCHCDCRAALEVLVDLNRGAAGLRCREGVQSPQEGHGWLLCSATIWDGSEIRPHRRCKTALGGSYPFSWELLPPHVPSEAAGDPGLPLASLLNGATWPGCAELECAHTSGCIGTATELKKQLCPIMNPPDLLFPLNPSTPAQPCFRLREAQRQSCPVSNQVFFNPEETTTNTAPLRWQHQLAHSWDSLWQIRGPHQAGTGGRDTAGCERKEPRM